MYSTFMPLAMWKTSNCDYGIQWFIFLHSFESWFNLEWLIWWCLFLNRAVHFCGRNIWQNFQALDEIHAKNWVKNIPPQKKNMCFFSNKYRENPNGLRLSLSESIGEHLGRSPKFFPNSYTPTAATNTTNSCTVQKPKMVKKRRFCASEKTRMLSKFYRDCC